MQVVLLVTAVVILGGVVLAALGRVGEMATFASDTPPMDLDEVSATDVALLRPPMSLWGYNAQATEDALRVIARSVTARDVEIATLRRELADLRGNTAGAQATRTGPVSLAGQRPSAARQGTDPLAAYRPPDSAAATQPPAPAAASEPSSPGAATQPPAPAAATQSAGQTPHTEPPGEADPPTEDDWLPLWQRSSEPGPDE